MSSEGERDADDKAEKLARINTMFTHFVPHNRALALEVLDFGKGMALLRLPYAPHLVGHPATGVLHGGAITSLVDATCGASVFMRMREPSPIATLDLRIDYLRPAEPATDVFARAECHRITRNVAFVRAVAFTRDEADPVASASATFMIATAGLSIAERARRAGGADAE